jgi:TfoX/Sxy family transcriptional regulator of competence genes
LGIIIAASIAFGALPIVLAATLGSCSAFGGRCPADRPSLIDDDTFVMAATGAFLHPRRDGIVMVVLMGQPPAGLGAHLVERLRAVEPVLPYELSTRRMFGGTMVYADGAPVASLSEAGFAVKLVSPHHEQALSLPGAGPLRYGPDQPPRRHYVVLPDSVVDDDEALVRWLTAAADAAAPRQ